MSDTVSSTPKTWKSLVLLTVVPLFNLIYPALFFLSFFSLISLFPFYLRMSGCNHDDVGKECSQNEVSGVPSMTALSTVTPWAVIEGYKYIYRTKKVY